MSSFDLSSYISNYSGHTKIKRLLFIAQQNENLRLKALKLAIDELKKGINTQLYKETYEKYKDILSKESNYSFDETWINNTDHECQKKLDKLELELNSYRTNMIRDSIRSGNHELGNFYFSRGDYQNALKCYLRARDYSPTPQNVYEMCLNVIKVSVETGNYSLVSQYTSKAEVAVSNYQKSDNEALLYARIYIANGLSLLDSKNFKQSARKFIQIHSSLGKSYNEIFSSQDVALFGTLLSLASFDRVELKTQVIDNTNFKNFLELLPEVNDLLNYFYQSKYTKFLDTLKTLTPLISNDIFLAPHLEAITKSFRDKALCQYVSPFVSVDMNRMAKTFNTEVLDLEKELAKLIQEKQIKARIDSHNKVLFARIIDQKDMTFQTVTDLGSKYQNDTEKNILRMNILKYPDFCVKPKKMFSQGGGGKK